MVGSFNIAVVGATGNIGRLLISTLFNRNFPIKKLYAVSKNSIGHKIQFGAEEITTLPIEDIDFQQIHLAFTCVGADIASDIIPYITGAGALVIDKSHYFRMHPLVPLIIPELNIHTITTNTDIIASPNCCVIPLMLVLKPLDDVALIKRVVVATYQSVSGAGKAAIDELSRQTQSYGLSPQSTPQSNIFPKQIAFNLIPQIGQLLQDGSCEEEDKITKEIAKIMGRKIPISITCARVPIFVGHSCAVNIEFERYISVEEVNNILAACDGLTVVKNNHRDSFKNKYIDNSDVITPIDVTNRDEVFVSRIRQDHSIKNGLNLWITVDNLRKGAALNSVQIAEQLILNNII